MKRLGQTVICVALASAAFTVSACRDKAPSGSTPTASASPAAAAPSTAPMVSSSPVVLASPVDPTKPIPLPQAAEGMPKSLDAIPERLRRPLTLEEINALPPETRDMILKAQGRLPAKK